MKGTIILKKVASGSIFPWKWNVFHFHNVDQHQVGWFYLEFGCQLWVYTLVLHAKVWPLWPLGAFKFPWPHYGTVLTFKVNDYHSSCTFSSSTWCGYIYVIQSLLHTSYPFLVVTWCLCREWEYMWPNSRKKALVLYEHEQ